MKLGDLVWTTKRLSGGLKSRSSISHTEFEFGGESYRAVRWFGRVGVALCPYREVVIFALSDVNRSQLLNFARAYAYSGRATIGAPTSFILFVDELDQKIAYFVNEPDSKDIDAELFEIGKKQDIKD